MGVAQGDRSALSLSDLGIPPVPPLGAVLGGVEGWWHSPPAGWSLDQQESPELSERPRRGKLVVVETARPARQWVPGGGSQPPRAQVLEHPGFGARRFAGYVAGLAEEQIAAKKRPRCWVCGREEGSAAGLGATPIFDPGTGFRWRG